MTRAKLAKVVFSRGLSIPFIYECLKVRKIRKQALPQKQCQNKREKSRKHLIG